MERFGGGAEGACEDEGGAFAAVGERAECGACVVARRGESVFHGGGGLFRGQCVLEFVGGDEDAHGDPFGPNCEYGGIYGSATFGSLSRLERRYAEAR